MGDDSVGAIVQRNARKELRKLDLNQLRIRTQAAHEAREWPAKLS